MSVTLTNAQMVSTRLALGEPPEEQTSINYRIGLLDDDGRAKLITLVTEFDANYLNVTDINTGGVVIKAGDKLERIRCLIAQHLGWDSTRGTDIFVGRASIGDFHKQYPNRQDIDYEWT